MTNEFKREEIRQHAIDVLPEYKDSNVYGCDLHHELFNTDYYIIGTYDAKEWLDDNVYDVIGAIKEYEEFNFGEVSTDFSSPEKVVNMYAYILGEEILHESKTLQEKWDDKLSSDDIEQIINELKILTDES